MLVRRCRIQRRLVAAGLLLLFLLILLDHRFLLSQVKADDGAEHDTNDQLFTNELLLYLQHFRRGLNYFDDHADRLSLDALYAMRLCVGHLDALKRHMEHGDLHKLPRKLPTIIFQMTEQAEGVLEEGLRAIRNTHSLESRKYFERLGFVITHNWKPRLFDHSLALSFSTPLSERLSAPALREPASDACMQDMLGTGARHQRCTLQEHCVQNMMSPYGGRAYGYTLTHQVLFAELAAVRGCKDKYESALRRIASEDKNDFKRPRTINELFDVVCANIYLEMKDAMQHNMTLDASEKDLFLEQGSLCSFLGYPTVLPKQWLSTVVLWQTGLGCVDDGRGIAVRAGESLNRNKGDFRPSSRRHGRSFSTGRSLQWDPTSQDGCSQHATGLLLVYLTARVRYIVELRLNLHERDMSVLESSSVESPVASSSAPMSLPFGGSGKVLPSSQWSLAKSQIMAVSHALLKKLKQLQSYFTQTANADILERDISALT